MHIFVGVVIHTINLPGLHLAEHSSLVSKLFPLPRQPPYVNISHWPVALLKKYFFMAALHGPVTDGKEQTSFEPDKCQIHSKVSFEVSSYDLIEIIIYMAQLVVVDPQLLVVDQQLAVVDQQQ